MSELSDDFVRSLEEPESDIDPKVELLNLNEELKKIEIESIPKSTMDQMKSTSNRFINFLKAKMLSVQMETIPKKHLNNYLRYFYSELQLQITNCILLHLSCVSVWHCTAIFKLFAPMRTKSLNQTLILPIKC